MSAAPSDRVFVYVRLVAGHDVFHRSKIREFAGMGGLLADLLRGVAQAERPLPPDEVPALEYVDANSEQVLIRFQIDPARNLHRISGTIPPSPQPRMLDPQAGRVPTRRFVERAAPELSPERRDAVARDLASQRHDVLDKIREAIQPDGTFEVLMPLKG